MLMVPRMPLRPACHALGDADLKRVLQERSSIHSTAAAVNQRHAVHRDDAVADVDLPVPADGARDLALANGKRASCDCQAR